MAYDYARERDEAALEDFDDLRYELEQEALEADSDELHNGPCRSQYRCTDRMCGASDCSNCHPGCDGEEPPDAEE